MTSIWDLNRRGILRPRPQAKVKVWMNHAPRAFHAASRDLITVFNPIEGGLSITTDEEHNVTVDVTVSEVPEWLKPEPPPKPKPIEQQLYASLIGEPWTTMLAYADVLDERGDKLHVGWRIIAENKWWPQEWQGEYIWNADRAPTRNPTLLPWELFRNPFISSPCPQSTMPEEDKARIAIPRKEVVYCWNALARAIVEVEGIK